MPVVSIPPTSSVLHDLLLDQILLLDGAMGTMVQQLQLDDRQMCGERFAEHSHDLSNFVDILCLTQPSSVTQIHQAYLEAGADILETNTFCSSTLGLQE